jgi:hypothetical protein
LGCFLAKLRMAGLLNTLKNKFTKCKQRSQGVIREGCRGKYRALI